MSYPKHKNEELYRVFWQLLKNVKINHDTKCWEHGNPGVTGYIEVKTYNSPYFSGNSTSLHRLVYAVYHDQPLQTDQIIMHKCDNRKCVNPKHLQLGTIFQNNQDRAKKQRTRKKAQK